MQIQEVIAPLATSSIGLKRQIMAPPAVKTADTTTISKAARDLLAAEEAGAASRSSSHRFRVDGPVYTLEEAVKNKGGTLISVKMSDAQLSEIALREQQEKARETVNFNYAKAHQYQPVGQVLVNGKLVATVFDAGSFELMHATPKLSDESLSPADRLAEIARAVKGEVIHSNFLPTMGGWSGPSAPESMLPPLTARSLQQIFEQEIRPAMEKKIAEWEAETGKTYPRQVDSKAA